MDEINYKLIAKRLWDILKILNMKTSSYRDVVVYIDDVKYTPSQNYALELTCCKSAGWRLWKIWGGKSELIGGEFDNTRMCITVSDKVILGKLPKMPKLPDEFGWNGIVDTKKTN